MRPQLRRAARAPLGVIIFLLSLAATVPAEVLADLSVRYVNDEVITWGDIALRNQLRLELQRGRGTAPTTKAELLAYCQTSLEELTEEALLTQRAKEMNLAPDHDDIVLEVLEMAKRSGQGLTLREQSLQRRQLERTRTAERLVYFFDGLAPQPTPADLQAAYDAGGTRWDRPARLNALQIVLRPTGPEERQRQRTAKNGLLRRAQDLRSPQLAGEVQGYLAQFLSAASKDQETILDRLVASLAADHPDLDPADAGVIAEARSLQAQMAASIDLDQAFKRLEEVRLGLAGLAGDSLKTAFRTAGSISQAPVEPGWVEPGTFAPEWDRTAGTAPLGAVAPPFIAQGNAVLLLPVERDAARRRPFAEVSGEIERALRQQRRDRVRRQQVSILRAKASVKDLQDLSALIGR
jgi:parvulin-like peptidyl-prolyl isomerase